MHDVADQLLARRVLLVGLTGEDDLQRALAVGKKSGEALQIAKEQRAAFVGGKTARKTYRQRVRVELVEMPFGLGNGRALSAKLVAQVKTRKVDEALTAILVRVPQLAVGYFLDASPRMRVLLCQAPTVANMAFE